LDSTNIRLRHWWYASKIYLWKSWHRFN